MFSIKPGAPAARPRSKRDEKHPVRDPADSQSRAGLAPPAVLTARGARGRGWGGRGGANPGSVGAVRGAAAQICGEETGHKELIPPWPCRG